jgi:hypothetical protein
MSIKIQFGKYKGRTLDQINERDHQYIVFLSTIPSYGRPHVKEVIHAAKEMCTKDERQHTMAKKRYRNQKFDETRWIMDWLQHMSASDDLRTARFCKSIFRQISLEHRIDKISFKQLKILIHLWAEQYGAKGSQEYHQAQLEFIQHFEGKWTRKTCSLQDLMD